MISKIYLCCTNIQKKNYKDFLEELKTNYTLEDFTHASKGNNSLYLVIGGDGTLNYFINNIDPSLNISVIYIPAGTANDFSRSLKIVPFNPSLKIIEDIITGNTKIRVPLMQCNDRFFINVLTAGAPAKVTNSGSDLLKKVTGKLSYYLQALEEVINPDIYSIHFTTDNLVEGNLKTQGFIVSQGLYAGGGVKVNPSYSAKLGRTFDFLIPSHHRLADSLADILELQKDEPQNLNLKHYTCEKIKISANDKIPIKLDGEEYSAKELVIEKTQENILFYLP